MNFLIWTGGITVPALIKNLEVQKNKKGQLLVDAYCRLVDYPEVFCIGDSAQMQDPISGELLPPTAQAAELGGQYVAGNILRLIHGNTLKKERVVMRGMFAALGGEYGAGFVMNWLRIKGKKAFYFKKLIEKSYYYPLLKRCREGYKLMTQGD